MKKVLIGSHNSGKISIYKRFLSHLPINIVTLKDLGIHDDFSEHGNTFAENSRSKVEYYSQKSGLPTIGDDGGLEIDALNGEPGVLSRRWPGYEASDKELINIAFSKLKGTPRHLRTAYLGGVITLATPSKKSEQVTIRIKGILSEKLERPIVKGFPFRSIFWIPILNKYYYDLTDEELEHIDHRKQGLKKLEHYLT
ncbi:non-canonical purine NTP pyrophosphatase [Patescibacteria group bacterium]